jgi:hypothetical protein
MNKEPEAYANPSHYRERLENRRAERAITETKLSQKGAFLKQPVKSKKRLKNHTFLRRFFC